LLAVLAAVAMAVVACGGDEEPATTTPPATSAPAGGAVSITETDFSFQPADITASRTQPLEITNSGATLHNFTIEGTPVDVDTQPGETTTLDPPGSAIEPGSYVVFCEYHRGQGMEGTIEVTE
jgi:plastocyanin